MTITRDQLGRIFHLAPVARLDAVYPHLLAAMSEGQITTPIREAAFLAQCGHESGAFRYMEELADGSAYEGRKSLGNNSPGDGKRYKGRGPIQLTGKTNYWLAGISLGLDFIGHPEQVATYPVGFRVAVWFWTSNGLNKLADALPAGAAREAAFDAITRKVNGGLNGKADRDQYFARACMVLGC